MWVPQEGGKGACACGGRQQEGSRMQSGGHGRNRLPQNEARQHASIGQIHLPAPRVLHSHPYRSPGPPFPPFPAFPPTCTIGANDGNSVALLQVEVNVLEQRPSGVAVLEVLDGEHLLPHLLNLHRIRQE